MAVEAGGGGDQVAVVVELEDLEKVCTSDPYTASPLAARMVYQFSTNLSNYSGAGGGLVNNVTLGTNGGNSIFQQ